MCQVEKTSYGEIWFSPLSYILPCYSKATTAAPHHELSYK